MHVLVEIESREDAALMLREVADKIEDGYDSGIVGYSACSWSINN